MVARSKIEFSLDLGDLLSSQRANERERRGMCMGCTWVMIGIADSILLLSKTRSHVWSSDQAGCPRGGVDCVLDDGWVRLREIMRETII
jgi:hypothetical protein